MISYCWMTRCLLRMIQLRIKIESRILLLMEQVRKTGGIGRTSRASVIMTHIFISTRHVINHSLWNHIARKSHSELMYLLLSVVRWRRQVDILGKIQKYGTRMRKDWALKTMNEWKREDDRKLKIRNKMARWRFGIYHSEISTPDFRYLCHGIHMVLRICNNTMSNINVFTKSVAYSEGRFLKKM